MRARLCAQMNQTSKEHHHYALCKLHHYNLIPWVLIIKLVFNRCFNTQQTPGPDLVQYVDCVRCKMQIFRLLSHQNSTFTVISKSSNEVQFIPLGCQARWKMSVCFGRSVTFTSHSFLRRFLQLKGVSSAVSLKSSLGTGVELCGSQWELSSHKEEGGPPLKQWKHKSVEVSTYSHYFFFFFYTNNAFPRVMSSIVEDISLPQIATQADSVVMCSSSSEESLSGREPSGQNSSITHCLLLLLLQFPFSYFWFHPDDTSMYVFIRDFWHI